MSDFKRIPIKIDAATGRQINAYGAIIQSKDYFRLLFDETVILCCEFYDVDWTSGAAVLTPHPIPGDNDNDGNDDDMILAAFGDCDFDPETAFMFLTEQSVHPTHVNGAGDWHDNETAARASGQLSFRINTNTARFADALSKAKSTTKYYFVITGVPYGESAKSVLAYFQFKAENRPSSSAGEPVNADPAYYTADQTASLFLAAPERQFSVDGINNPHSIQNAAVDRFFRERRTVNGIPGEWTDWMEMIAGPQGEHGVDVFIYVAYASSDAGAGFSLTPSNSLKYRAEIHVAEEIASPDAEDFADVDWIKYIGDNGMDGDDGVNAYLYIAWASDASGTDFSLTQGVLRYRAELQTTSPIETPSASDFTGLWKLYVTGLWSNGFTAPDNGDGENGDNYINKALGDLYYKSAGVWDLIANIRGPAFTFNAQGPLSLKSAHDAEAAGFSYYATDTGNFYVKNSSTSGDWSSAQPFKGDKGDAFTYADFTPEQLADLQGPPGETPSFISGSFTNSSLTAGVLTITHTQGNIRLPFVITDDAGKSVTLDSANVTFASNEITVDLSIFGTIAGTWHYAFGGSAEGVVLEGAGDVVGPASSTDGNIVLFDGAGGKLIKDSGKSIVTVQSEAVATAKSANINAQTDSYTLVIGDAGKVVTMTKSSANTLTIPANSSVAFVTGAMIAIVMNGTGTTSITAAAGVSINGVTAGTGAIEGQYKSVMLIKTATDAWLVLGATGTIA